MISTEQELEVQQVAQALFTQKPDWVSFYRDILGLHGVVRRYFPTVEALAEFEKTDAYLDVQYMLKELRKQGHAPANPDDPTEVITVRLPKSMHDSLRREAHEHQTSMNKLCISKLLQFIDGQKVPKDLGF
jgi:predicted HicB family RNase H-like nuclease